MEAAHQRLAGGHVEVVVEIGDEDDVVALAEIYREGAAGEELILRVKTGGGDFGAGDVEDGGEVLGHDFGCGVAAGKGHTEESVAGGDVEDLGGGCGLAGDIRHELGGRRQH